MQTAMIRSPAPINGAEIRDVSSATVLRLHRVWAGSDYGFGDGAGCDDYYVEPAQELEAGRRKAKD